MKHLSYSKNMPPIQLLNFVSDYVLKVKRQSEQKEKKKKNKKSKAVYKHK